MDLKSYPDSVQKLALHASKLLREWLPGAKETEDSAARMFAYAYGSGYRGMICTLIMSQSGIKLGIVGGASFEDRHNLLRGSGKVHRHVPLKAVQDLQQPGVKELVEAASAACNQRLGGVRLRPPDPGYLRLLSSYSEAIRKLALAARKLILEEAPMASEFVYQVYTIADHFSFTDRPSDAFVFTTTHANWVNLGFNFGSMLPDPDGLLRGEGKLIRHVRIAQAADLAAPGVRELVRAAMVQAERPEDRAGNPRTVVHLAQSAKKRSARSRT